MSIIFMYIFNFRCSNPKQSVIGKKFTVDDNAIDKGLKIEAGLLSTTQCPKKILTTLFQRLRKGSLREWAVYLFYSMGYKITLKQELKTF